MSCISTPRRVFVKVCDGASGDGGEERGTGKSFAIPCDGLADSVAELKRIALERWLENGKEGEERAKLAADRYNLVLSGNGARLSEKDSISSVLRDGDTLKLQLKECSHFMLGAPHQLLPTYSHQLCQTLMEVENKEILELDGNSLTVENLMKIGQGEYQVKVSQSAIEVVKKSRQVIDDIVSSKRVVYGVTTGFGKFENVVISSEKTQELQENLIRSHAAGVGPPLTPDQTRRLLTLRLNVLAKGFSGVRLETVEILEKALNASCLPLIPQQGTLGASGDLAPLSHLALGLMGEGKMWSPSTGWDDAAEVMKVHNISPLILGPKEGIALINGTQMITALGAEALSRAEAIANQADVIAALTIDVLRGTPTAFDYDIHANRPHYGQQVAAARLRALLDSDVHPSKIRDSHRNCSRVQDPYTMRCVPQVHGVVRDTLEFVKGIITTEMNSALDNPMVLADRNMTISGGNFHGEYPAKVLDYLAIAVHELANMSERRQERLMNPDLCAHSKMTENGVTQRLLPSFLTQDGGLNSGFMIAHCTAAALVSENKVLTHPSSVDSISTSAAQEDHVSMGGFAARKALRVVSHVEQVLAIELLACCQALEFHRPNTTTAPLEEVHKLVRTIVRPWTSDRYMAPDIETATDLLRNGKVMEAVQPYIDRYLLTETNRPIKRPQQTALTSDEEQPIKRPCLSSSDRE